MLRRALVVQHQDDCPPGVLADWAAEQGVVLDVVRPDRGDALPDTRSYDGVCVLGSDRSVNDDEPWIAAELDWLRGVVASTPVLGICFGAQALALALDGEVHRAAAEIDWLTLQVVAGAGFATGPWLCWHNDFITPPAGAKVLARSARAVHAFSSGPHLAVQFHPEVTADIVDAWTDADGLRRDLARAGVDACALGRRSRAFAPEAGIAAHELFTTWAATAAHSPIAP